MRQLCSVQRRAASLAQGTGFTTAPASTLISAEQQVLLGTSQWCLCWPRQDVAFRSEPGSVTGAIPGLLCWIPSDQAAQVSTYGGHLFCPAFLISINRHLL